MDAILEVDEAESAIKARMPTHAELPLTREQRTHPVRHPAHVSGGLMVHMTGMVGFAHAYYILKLRHADGWVGYGARIHSARFTGLAGLGAPLILEGRALRVRRGKEQIVARYGFRFMQENELIYEGEQTAIWQKISLTP